MNTKTIEPIQSCKLHMDYDTETPEVVKVHLHGVFADIGGTLLLCMRQNETMADLVLAAAEAFISMREKDNNKQS